MWNNWSQHLDIALPSDHVPRWFVDAPQLFPSSIHRSKSEQRTQLGRWWRLGWSWWVGKKAGRCTWGTSRPAGSAAQVVGTFGKVVAPWSEVAACGKPAIGIEMKTVDFPGWISQPGPGLSPRLAPGSSLTRRWTGPKRVDLFWLVGICWTYIFWLVGICWTYFNWLGFAELLSRGVHIGFLQSTHLNSHHVSNGYSSTYDLDPENLQCFSRWSIIRHWW